MPVYFIQAGEAGPVKIGHSARPRLRLANMQIGNPDRLRIIRLFEGGAPEELALHERFAEHRIVGEWFSPAPDILEGDIGLPAATLPSPAKRIAPRGRSKPQLPIIARRGDPDFGLKMRCHFAKTRLAYWADAATRTKHPWCVLQAAKAAADAERITGIPRHELRPDLWEAPGGEAA